MTRPLHASLVGMLVALAACTTGTDDPTDTDVAVLPLPTGAYAAADGPPVFYATELLGEVAYIDFDSTAPGAGFLSFFGQDPVSGRLFCEDGLFSADLDGGLGVSLSADAGSTDAYLFAWQGDDLVITNAFGDSQTFSAVPEVPAEAQCGTVTITEDASFGLELSSWSNLLWDGSAIRLPTDDGVFALHIANGSASDPLPYHATYDHLFTMQGTDGWGTCACGDVREAYRSDTTGAFLDAIDTAALATKIVIVGGTWSGTHLWLTGYGEDPNTPRLLKIDSDAEPDVVQTTLELGVQPQAIAMHQGTLYGLHNGALLEIQTSNGTIVNTWALPEPSTQYNGLTSDGTSLVVSGWTPDQMTKVARITLD